jgi:alpha-beta hydrolase superfamily lysophospholipase
MHGSKRRIGVLVGEALASTILASLAVPAHSQVPIPRTTGFATARDGTRPYYEKSGSGPALVFLHGIGGNHAIWFHQVPVFATHFTVVTMSQRGFAPSSGRLDRYDVGLLVDDLLAVLDACDVRRISIVGQSMGGWCHPRINP